MKGIQKTFKIHISLCFFRTRKILSVVTKPVSDTHASSVWSYIHNIEYLTDFVFMLMLKYSVHLFGFSCLSCYYRFLSIVFFTVYV